MTLADTIEQYKRAVHADDSRQQEELGWKLLASGDPGALSEWLLRNPPLSQSLTGPGGRSTSNQTFGGTLQGFALRGGAGTPFPPNPWGLTGDLTVTQVIDQVWAAVAEDAAEFIAAMKDQVFGVVLVSYAGRQCLAYIYYQGYLPKGRESYAGASIAELSTVEFGSIETFWGDQPLTQSSPEVLALFNGELPRPLQRLSAIHGSLYFTGSEGFLDVAESQVYEGWETANIEQGRYIAFAGFQDGAAMIDLKTSTSGNTLVAEHDPNDGLRLPPVPFWNWFAEYHTMYITGG